MQLNTISSSIEILTVTFLLINFITCIWILVGIHTPDSWIYNDDTIKELGKFEENKSYYYVYALNFLLTVFTTVGYGNDYSHSQRELEFIICIEFGSVIVQAGLILSMGKLFGGFDHSFKRQIRDKLDKVDLWILEI